MGNGNDDDEQGREFKRVRFHRYLYDMIEIPSDIASYIAHLAICTRFCIHDRYGSLVDMRCYQSSTIDIAIRYQQASLSGVYFQDYVKCYQKHYKKSVFRRSIAIKGEKFDRTHYRRPMHYNQVVSKKLKKEVDRLYKFWLICQIRIIPMSLSCIQ